MSTIPQRTFAVGRSLVWLIRIVGWVFVAGTLAALAAAGRELIAPTDGLREAFADVLASLVFGGFALLGFRLLHQFPRAATTVDDEGLWPAALHKGEGLVRWQDIASVRERRVGQRLELLDRAGHVLMKLEYQLEGFEELRRLVLERMHRPQTRATCPMVFARSTGFHVIYFVVIAVAAAMSCGATFVHVWFGIIFFAVLAILLLSEYLRTPICLSLDRHQLNFRYPLRSRSLGLAGVDSISLVDTFVRGSRVPEVILAAHTLGKPLRIKSFGIDTTQLYASLLQWKERQLFD